MIQDIKSGMSVLDAVAKHASPELTEIESAFETARQEFERIRDMTPEQVLEEYRGSLENKRSELRTKRQEYQHLLEAAQIFGRIRDPWFDARAAELVKEAAKLREEIIALVDQVAAMEVMSPQVAHSIALMALPALIHELTQLVEEDKNGRVKRYREAKSERLELLQDVLHRDSGGVKEIRETSP